ncbi:MAG: hypothetical protein ACK521_08900 [bacterium]
MQGAVWLQGGSEEVSGILSGTAEKHDEALIMQNWLLDRPKATSNLRLAKEGKNDREELQAQTL